MGESSQPRARLPRRTLGTIVPTNFGKENLSDFGLVCSVLWPNEKLDVVISQGAGCTDRAARQYIRGDREPSYEALMVVMDRLRPRRRPS